MFLVFYVVRYILKKIILNTRCICTKSFLNFRCLSWLPKHLNTMDINQKNTKQTKHESIVQKMWRNVLKYLFSSLYSFINSSLLPKIVDLFFVLIRWEKDNNTIRNNGTDINNDISQFLHLNIIRKLEKDFLISSMWCFPILKA